MKEAIGGAFSIEFILVFLLLLNGYLAFSVNYSKAFRVKDEIRSIIQKNEGLTESATSDIGAYMQKVNYTQNQEFTNWCSRRGYNICTVNNRSFCYEVATSDKYGVDATGNEIGAYYTVYTFVDINIPVINNLLPFTAGLFQVSGETSLIYTSQTPWKNGHLQSEAWCGNNKTVINDIK